MKPVVCKVVAGMKYILSLSGGKDSLALFLRVIEENYPLDYVVFYDTGMEFQAIYNNIARAEALCEENGIRFIRLEPTRPFEYDMLHKPICTRDGSEKTGRGWCGGLCRWGTAEKREAINRFYKSLGDEAVVEYVGIAADERQRINRDRQRNSVKLYPLIEWDMTEADCLAYCYNKGWNWQENGVELYDVLDRVSCWCCSNKNKKELYNMYRQLPEYWNRLKELQSQIAQPFKSYGSIFELEQEFAFGYQAKCRPVQQNPNQMQLF